MLLKFKEDTSEEESEPYLLQLVRVAAERTFLFGLLFPATFSVAFWQVLQVPDYLVRYSVNK